MNKIWFFGVVFTVMLVFSIGTAYSQSGQLPSWIKNVAGYWADDQISDAEFLAAIEYLVSNKIITISEDTNIVSTNVEPNTTPIEVGVISWTSMIDMISVVNGLDKSDPEILGSIQSWLDEDEYFGKGADYLSILRLGNDRIPFDGMIRYNSEYIGQEIFLLGKVLEVKDVQNNQYEVQVDITSINFESDDGVAVVKYLGPRIRDGDIILVTGLVSNIQIVEIQGLDQITKLKNAGIAINVEEGKTSVQVELPVITGSQIHRLVNPYDLIPLELDRTALRIPYDKLTEYDEILNGSIVHYQGTVTSVKTQGDILTSFRLDVDPARDHLDIIVVKGGVEGIDISQFQHTPHFIQTPSELQGYNWIDISKNDIIDVYGLITASSSSKTPDIYALHITNQDKLE